MADAAAAAAGVFPVDDAYAKLHEALVAVTAAAGTLTLAHGALLAHNVHLVTTLNALPQVRAAGSGVFFF